MLDPRIALLLSNIFKMLLICVNNGCATLSEYTLL